MFAFCYAEYGPSSVPNLSDLDPEVRESLQIQLDLNWMEIQKHFALFTSFIHDKVVDHADVTVRNLCYLLLQLPALVRDSHTKNSNPFYSATAELEKATTVEQLFRLLIRHTTFLDYEIYVTIAEKYGINVEVKKK